MTKKKPVVKKKTGVEKSEEILTRKIEPKEALQKAILEVVKTGEHLGKTRKGEINKTSLYLIGLLQGKNKKTAALDAGYSMACANTPAAAIESTDQFKQAREAFMSEMVTQGITIGSITEALVEMLEKRESSLASGRAVVGTQIDAGSAKMAIDAISKLLGLNAPEKKLVVVADLRDVKELSEQELDEELRKLTQ